MSTDTLPTDDCEIRVSFTARKKAFRMYQPYKIREKVRTLDGELHRRASSTEYHLRTWRQRYHRQEEIVLVLKIGVGQITVVTQMHDHINYHEDSDFRQVGGFERD